MQQADLFFSGSGNFPSQDFLAYAAKPAAVFVLPCGRRKLSVPAQARDLYISPRFRTLRRLVETLEAPYLIASARHGLIEPETVLSPYDEDLSTWPHDAQAGWGQRVLDSLSLHGGEADGGDHPSVSSWGVGSQAPKPIPDSEIAHELRVRSSAIATLRLGKLSSSLRVAKRS